MKLAVLIHLRVWKLWVGNMQNYASKRPISRPNLLQRVRLCRRKIHDRYIENQRAWIRNIGLSILGLAIGVTILNLMLPRPSHFDSTPLNQQMTVGTQAKSATLTQREFNAKQGVLQLNFSLSDDNNGNTDSLVNVSDFNFQAVAEHGGSHVNGQVIPTSDNTVIVRFNHLARGFNAVFVSISDKQIDPSQITNPDNTAALSSAKKSTSAAPKSNATFVINRDKVATNNVLKMVSQKQLALQEYDHKISLENKLIKINQASMKKLNQAIKQSLSTLQTYQNQLQKSGDDSENSLTQSIQKVQDNIQEALSGITAAQQNITKAKADKSDLLKTKSAIQSNKITLPKVRNL